LTARIGVTQSYEDSLNPRADDRVGAGGIVLERGGHTWLKGDVEIGAAGERPSLLQCEELRMRATELRVPAFPENYILLDDDRSDQRVGAGPPGAALG
jgi:hypothetical protein